MRSAFDEHHLLFLTITKATFTETKTVKHLLVATVTLLRYSLVGTIFQ